MEESDKKKESNEFIDSIIGSITTENIGRYGEAASEYIKGYKGITDNNGKIIKKGLKQVSQSKVNPEFKYQNIKQQAGFSAEIHYVDNTNAQNIIKKNNERIYRSNDIGRGNDTRIDVLSVDEFGNPTWSAQMKFCGKFRTPEEIKESSQELVKKMIGDKWERYRGNRVLVPNEQYKIAREYAEKNAKDLSQQANKFRSQGNIEKANLLDQKAAKFLQVSNDLEDSGITSKEAIFLREHPKLATAKYVAKTANQSGLENAKSAAVLSGAISTAKNVACIIKGDKDITEAVKNISIDMASSAATAYVVGAGDTAIRGFMASSKNSVFVNLSKSNMPAMIATTAVQVGKSIIRYTNGEIDSLQLVEELGEKGTGMMAASFGAAVGTAIFPGIGTVIGGMVGYMTSSTLYGASIQILSEEHLSLECRKRVHAIATAAIESMTAQRKELIVSINKFYNNRESVFKESFNTMDIAIESNDLNEFTKALNNIALEIGSTLQFKNFDEFNNFMLDKNMKLEF